MWVGPLKLLGMHGSGCGISFWVSHVGQRKTKICGWRTLSDGIGTEVGDASGEGLESMEWALWGKEISCNVGSFSPAGRGLVGDGLSLTELSS